MRKKKLHSVCIQLHNKYFFFSLCRWWDACRLTFKGHSNTSIYVSISIYTYIICITVGFVDFIGESVSIYNIYVLHSLDRCVHCTYTCIYELRCYRNKTSTLIVTWTSTIINIDFSVLCDVFPFLSFVRQKKKKLPCVSMACVNGMLNVQ